MSGPLNLEHLLFHVDEDNAVYLCYGPMSVFVCADVGDFDDFMGDLLQKLGQMSLEIEENYEPQD